MGPVALPLLAPDLLAAPAAAAAAAAERGVAVAAAAAPGWKRLLQLRLLQADTAAAAAPGWGHPNCRMAACGLECGDVPAVLPLPRRTAWRQKRDKEVSQNRDKKARTN